MFKNLFLLVVTSCFVFFSGFSFAQPAKVSAVIPVQFNGKGLHAPVPYSQQMMQKGYTRVPTMNLPFTFSGGSKFNPTTVSKKSLARALGNAAGNVARMNPATKAALAAYGAYELNCFSGSYPAMCFNQPWEGDTPPPGAQSTPPVKAATTLCAGYNNKNFSMIGQVDGMACTVEAKNRFQSERMRDHNVGRACASQVVSNFPTYWTVQDRFLTQDGQCGLSGSPYSMSVGSRVIAYQQDDVCPPEGPAWKNYTKIATVTENGQQVKRCFQPAMPTPVTPTWVEEQINTNPAPIGNLDLTDFVDPTTGAPDPNLFENPTVDDVSPAFREAAEAAARGTLQQTNPNAEGYVPPNLYQDFVINLNNWYEGNTFTDVFTNKPVTPDAPKPEPTKTDWTDFPGITQKQYEASNNAWAQSATSQAPSIQQEIAKVESEFTKLTDEISNVPTALPYSEINLVDLVVFPSGGCSGFSVDVSLAGQPKTILVDKHCPPYDAWGRPFVEWILSILTILQIFHVFRRTLEVA